MFKSIGGFFTDFVAPVALSVINPFLGAAYSGIKTGIQTGSPLAGLGSAGLSFATASALKGITGKILSPVESGTSTVFQDLSRKGLEGGIGSLSELPTTGFQSAFQDAAQSVLVDRGLAEAATSPIASGLTETAKTGIVDTISQNIQTPLSELYTTGTSGAITRALPEFITSQDPMTIGAVGLGARVLGTPMEAPQPAPIPRIVDEEAGGDYSYKGPLDRGPYTYADPEDIAYGRVTPSSYGYLGAKQGGVIKAQGGGVMMQSGPYNPEIEKRKATFRPTGSMSIIPPGIASFARTQPGMTMKPQLTRGLGAPVAPTVPTSAAALPRQNIPSAALAPMPMSGIAAPQSTQDASKLVSQGKQIAKQLPQLAQAASQAVPVALQKEVQNLEKLPQKDINVNIDQVRNLLGLAGGGSIPSSTDLPEEEFASIGIYRNPDEYDTDKMMAEGGEVKSDKTLQENAFVIPADVVGHIGDGSSDAGAQRLQQFLGMNPQQYQAGGIMAGELQGPGGGMDDLIQTSIEGKRAAAVSPQEFVVPRDIVAELGQGSYDKGSNKLYALMRNVRKTKTGTTKQPAELTQGLGQLMRTAIG